MEEIRAASSVMSECELFLCVLSALTVSVLLACKGEAPPPPRLQLPALPVNKPVYCLGPYLIRDV